MAIKMSSMAMMVISAMLTLLKQAECKRRRLFCTESLSSCESRCDGTDESCEYEVSMVQGIMVPRGYCCYKGHIGVIAGCVVLGVILITVITVVSCYCCPGCPWHTRRKARLVRPQPVVHQSAPRPAPGYPPAPL